MPKEQTGDGLSMKQKMGGESAQGLVRWAKERSHLPPELPTVPPLKKGDRSNEYATTFEEKVAVLHARFFPPEPDAELGDIQGQEYTGELEQTPLLMKWWQRCWPGQRRPKPPDRME